MPGEGWGSLGNRIEDSTNGNNGRNDRKAWTVAWLEFTRRKCSNPFSRSI
jgi:hypothetical protein